ncbi:GNAT family N-acetyltransferase [Duganella sp. LX20W]|uniref:GNAT family N-acetyltransferase n=1 Tax=Rugamonas brunnea TaxID=2758569 RepID=A0A7W2ENN5_9BURK|nr:GNAT family N-acetyltransferase [Rugamonas brunnea]MBA5635828.1 GNAT family N-acetyltransferase [Rugamonas brunnea]
MSLALSFRPLAKPPTKLLHAMRRDAGWPAANRADQAQPHPMGRVQWVSVESGKATIAIARLELAPPEFCYLADLIVASKHRGQGVGRWFLQHIEQYCVGQGIRRLLLQAAPDTEPFYTALLFAPDARAPGFLKKDLNPFQRKLFTAPAGHARP